MRKIIYTPTLHNSNIEELTQRIQMYLNQTFSLQEIENSSIEINFDDDLSINDLKSLDYALTSLGYIRH